MSVLELKDSIFELLINEIRNDREKLARIRQSILEIVDETLDEDDELTPRQLAYLDEAILECDDESKMTSSEDVKKMAAQWLSA